MNAALESNKDTPQASSVGRQTFDEVVVPTYAPSAVVPVRASGLDLWDQEDKHYLDFTAGIAVTGLGHANPAVVAALTNQAQKLWHTGNGYTNEPVLRLAQAITGATFADRAFFCNSGAEANEAALKLARKVGHNKFGGSKPRIVSFLNSFHGRTLAAIAATGQEKVKKGFEPMVDGFEHLPFNDGPALLAAMDGNVAAVLLEPVQGESGIHAATAHFLRMARSICDDYGALLMFDEVQCGLGRTGDWCGWRSIAPEVIPDAISWAKGIAGGFPLGAVWVRDRPFTLKGGGTVSLADLLGPGSHGTTFGGTPLVCSGALEVIRIIEEEGLLENSRVLGAYAKKAVEGLCSPLIAEVRGLGLMLGIELVADFAARAGCGQRPPSLWLVDRLHEAGMLTIPSGTQAIRWLPPLNVKREEVTQAVDILRGVLEKAA